MDWISKSRAVLSEIDAFDNTADDLGDDKDVDEDNDMNMDVENNEEETNVIIAAPDSILKNSSQIPTTPKMNQSPKKNIKTLSKEKKLTKFEALKGNKVMLPIFRHSK